MGDHQFGSFTQGIIDLLINTTGEFVTERSQGPYDEITEFDPPDVPSPPCTHTCWSLANQQRAPEILIDSFL